MRFEVNEYHRDITDKELLEDIRIVAQKLQKETLTSGEYTANGKFHSSTIMKRFGGWNIALDKANLKRKKEFHLRRDNVGVSNSKLLKDLRDTASALNQDSITSTEYDKHGKHGASIIKSRFMSWEAALRAAGLRPTGFHHKILEIELLEEIERIWTELGRQPTSTDIKRGISKYSLQSYARKFGGWRGALRAFVEWVEQEEGIEKEDESHENIEELPQCADLEEEKPREPMRKTSREINLRLRFKVMQRDNFKCCICGASPAKNPDVELHIDHIKPWSKGGETCFENLQTLCSKCNLGKSDLFE